MATNIVETIQASLAYPVLEKIDPNIQETKDKKSRTGEEKLAQSAIPAVLAGLFSFTREVDGCNYILAGGGKKSWLDAIFKDNRNRAVEKVAHYAGLQIDEAAARMEEIAQEAVLIIHKEMGEKHSAEKLKEYMGGQRHNILVYLPAAMQMGDLLGNDSLDDRTNKMEGPISNFMHKIENSMSKSDETKYP